MCCPLSVLVVTIDLVTLNTQLFHLPKPKPMIGQCDQFQCIAHTIILITALFSTSSLIVNECPPLQSLTNPNSCLICEKETSLIYKYRGWENQTSLSSSSSSDVAICSASVFITRRWPPFSPPFSLFLSLQSLCLLKSSPLLLVRQFSSHSVSQHTHTDALIFV